MTRNNNLIDFINNGICSFENIRDDIINSTDPGVINNYFKLIMNNNWFEISDKMVLNDTQSSELKEIFLDIITSYNITNEYILKVYNAIYLIGSNIINPIILRIGVIEIYIEPIK